MPALQIMKEVGREWQELDEEGRHAFQIKADQDKVRFKREKNAFESRMKKLASSTQNYDSTILDDLKVDPTRPGKKKRKTSESNEAITLKIVNQAEPDSNGKQTPVVDKENLQLEFVTPKEVS